MKKILLLGVFVVLIGGTAAYLSTNQSTSEAPETEHYTIGVTQIVSHPALDTVRTSMLRRLAERGYVEGENLTVIFRNANGDQSLTLPIATDFVAKGVDVIVPITTPSTLAAASVTENIPIVFAGVSYPVETGLVESFEAPGGNITGTSDQWPFAKQVATYLELQPHASTVGMLYNPGDDVGVRGVKAVTSYTNAADLTLKSKAISQAADVYPAAVALARTVDFIYTGIDLVVIENMSALFKAAQENQTPVVAGDSSAVKDGAVMALSVSMESVGSLTGDSVADVLEGKSPAEIPVKAVSDGTLYINQKLAELYGLDLTLIATKYPEATIYSD